MGGFHQLRVRQKQIHKRYACLDFKSWFVGSGVIAKGSADQAIEGRHYYRSMRILKESFNALVQYSFEKAMLENGDDFSEIKNVILNLRKETTSANLEAVLQHFSFEVVVEKILDDRKGTHSANISCFPRGLEDVFKTYLQYVLLKRLQEVFKTLSRRLQDVFARRLAIMSSRRLGRQKMLH